jgi:hypothetical protein
VTDFVYKKQYIFCPKKLNNNKYEYCGTVLEIVIADTYSTILPQDASYSVLHAIWQFNTFINKYTHKHKECMKVIVFWDVVLCSLVEVHWHFRGACCLYHQGVKLLPFPTLMPILVMDKEWHSERIRLFYEAHCAVSTASCYVHFLMSKYFHHFVLKHSQFVFIP